MRNFRKRSHDDENSSSSSSSKINHNKNYRSHHHNHRISPISDYPNHNSHKKITGKRSNFISYTEISSLPPKVKILCEIIAKTPAASVESYLEDTGIRLSQEDVEEVLKLSYDFPAASVKFFRWASFRIQLSGKHSPHAWNLVVDLLGKNCLFDAMWDAIKSMRKELLLSLCTFESVFSSYAIDNRVQEAILNVMALNSLLRAICRVRKTQHAREYFNIVKEKIRVDSETYTILLEGWEKEGDEDRAKSTFSEMVSDIGWDPRNVLAYDSFLRALLKGSGGTSEVLKFFDTMKDRGCYPGMKFFKFAIDECVRKSDAKFAKVVWESMVGKNICRPNVKLYNSLISLYCNLKDFVLAEKLLDEMVYNGAFPDSETYGLLFHFMIKQRRIKEATPIFKEMVKNEIVPMQQDCSMAVKEYIEGRDSIMGIKVWRFMIENYSSDLDETGNLLVLGLRDINRVPEAVKCAEDMIERGIKLNSATLSKLKQSLSKAGKAFAYDELLSKWKNHS
ncbi:hypothetical protein ACJIZ3_014584 [Penstemon smallii]|uniref:Pentatricopeptide repeat-containing protein n=1 Tax=Penstemon smallii TaxID=265156 RepID=A0ABD3RNF2_9LAMI